MNVCLFLNVSNNKCYWYSRNSLDQPQKRKKEKNNVKISINLPFVTQKT